MENQQQQESIFSFHLNNNSSSSSNGDNNNNSNVLNNAANLENEISGAVENENENQEDLIVRPSSPYKIPAKPWWNDAIECRDVSVFEKIEMVGEGTYGQVFSAREKGKRNGPIFALKKVRMENEKEGFPVTAMREISILLRLDHPNIVRLHEVVTGQKKNSVFLVFEYCEHDLAGLLDNMKTPFSESEVKCLVLQLLAAVEYLHDHWIIHRDIKMSNLLLTNNGTVKLGDFGLARSYGHPTKSYTQRVVTLWYRAPELLLGATNYTEAIDLWSVGCIFGEFLQCAPLVPGKTEISQIKLIFDLLGAPNPQIWPSMVDLPMYRQTMGWGQPFNNLRSKMKHISQEGLDLLNKLLKYCPEKRITANEAIEHPYFREHPLPKDKSLLPTFPELRGQQFRTVKHELGCEDRGPQAKRANVAKDPGQRILPQQQQQFNKQKGNYGSVF